jgi:hypothetical protein
LKSIESPVVLIEERIKKQKKNEKKQRNGDKEGCILSLYERKEWTGKERNKGRKETGIKTPWSK